MTIKRHLILTCLAIGLIGGGCSTAEEPVAPIPPPTGGVKLARGLGSFVFDGYAPLADKPITVWYFSPKAIPSELPIVFVFHGNARDADNYRDAWVSPADEHQLLVFAPEFDEGFFPGSAGYAQGNTFDDSNNAVSEELWTFSYVEPLFDYVKELVASDAEEYYVYGHSAGSQFVHRFLLFKPDNRVARAVAANAGWYTLPDLTESFPYGLRNSGLTEDDLDAYLSQPLVVLLGERDTDPNSPGLRQTSRARAQGAHRFARGQYFHAAGGSASTTRGVPLAWQLDTVPNVGHSSTRMTPPAARIIAGQ